MKSVSQNLNSFTSRHHNKLVHYEETPLEQRDPSQYNLKSKDSMQKCNKNTKIRRHKKRTNFTRISDSNNKNSRMTSQYSSRGQKNVGRDSYTGEGPVSDTSIPLFIGGLGTTIDHDVLSRLLERTGPFHDLQLAYNPKNGAPRGYAFFRVWSGRVARNFLSHNFRVGSRRLFCQLRSPKTREEVERVERFRIFIRGDLICVQERSLLEHFEQYGDVKLVHILKDSNTGCPQNFAFIEFYSEECVRKATQTEHQNVQGVDIQVQNYNTGRNGPSNSVSVPNINSSIQNKSEIRNLRNDESKQHKRKQGGGRKNIIEKEDKNSSQNQTSKEMRSSFKKSRALKRPNQYQHQHHYLRETTTLSQQKDSEFSCYNSKSSDLSEINYQNHSGCYHSKNSTQQLKQQNNPPGTTHSLFKTAQHPQRLPNTPGSPEQGLRDSEIQQGGGRCLRGSQNLERGSAQLCLLEELLEYFRYNYTPDSSDSCCSMALKKAIRRSKHMDRSQTNYVINLFKQNSRKDIYLL